MPAGDLHKVHWENFRFILSWLGKEGARLTVLWWALARNFHLHIYTTKHFIEKATKGKPVN